MNFQKFNEYVNEAATYTDKYADLTLSILQTIAQNKMLHWGTTSYAQHKTFCDFMEEFDALGDSLIESIMGKFGRPLTGGASIEVLDYNQIDVIAYFDNLYEYYTAAIDQFQPKEQNEEIVNILAEIIALIDKAKYLLTLNESSSIREAHEFYDLFFNSHLQHNPECDILEGHLDKDSLITYGIYVKGPKEGTEFMEYYSGSNYNPKSDKKSTSRIFTVDKIPAKYRSKWEDLKKIYQDEYAGSGVSTRNESIVNEASNNEDDRVLNFLKRIAKDFDYPVVHAANFVKAAIKRLGY